MKYTKGPWIILDHYEPGRILIDSGQYPNSTPVAEIISVRDTKRANAILIASAPEMLEALETCLNYFNYSEERDSKEYAKEVRALIAKARGE